MRIGLIFMILVPMNVAANMNTLIQNCQGLMLIDEKFSRFIISKAAAAMSPTMEGRRPDIMLCICGELMYRINRRQMRIIIMNEGSMRAKVAVALPRVHNHSLMPALCAAVYPQ